MSGITLAASTRANLLATQNTTDALDRTSLRLSTAKRVNATTDNPLTFVMAKSLTNKANEFLAAKAPMGQSLSAIGSTLTGIKAISSIVDQMKATANDAINNPPEGRADAAKRFNTLREQLNSLANDAGYKGVNLLSSPAQDLKINFDQNSGSSLTIDGVPSDAAALGIGDGVTSFNSFATDADIQSAISALGDAKNTLRSTASQIGNSASIINTRLDFTENLANTFESGANKLVDADLNEEAAHLLALKISHELGNASLGITNQSQQAILQLF